MAFPATYNLSYYKGDTHEFRVYPKDSSGAAFDLTNYISDNMKFSIAASRGAVPIVEAFVQKAVDGSHIFCAIRPEDGELLSAGTSYVYDLEIAATGEQYNTVHTLMTGTISVTEQVTQPYELTAGGNGGGTTITQTIEVSSDGVDLYADSVIYNTYQLTEGLTYAFNVTSNQPGELFYISESSTNPAVPFSSGVTNNGATSGQTITFTPPVGTSITNSILYVLVEGGTTFGYVTLNIVAGA